MTVDPHERRLVLRAQSGDRDAFDALLGGVTPALLRYVARVTGDAAMAEDVVQETLIAIVRKIAWLSEPSLFRAWAYRIASREAFRVLKQQRIFADRVEDVAFEEAPADPWLRERLLAASRAVITLHYFEEMPLAEVAAVLDVKPGTVKSRLAYGLAQLRKENSA
jgi:RNA polymerase sigma-70 factor, ECF subfamily